MPYFTRIMKADEGNLTFYFNRIYTVEGVRYHVSVLDKFRKAVIFQMEEKDKDNWSLINAADIPNWIQKIEKELKETVLDHVHEA